MRVVDGDTMEFYIDLGLRTIRPEIIRLAGVDVYERYDDLGKQATAYVKKVLKEEKIIYLISEKRFDTWGKYGRYLAYVMFEEDGVWVDLTQRLKDLGYEKRRDGRRLRSSKR